MNVSPPSYDETIGAIYLFVGGGGVSENTVYRLRENEANMTESRWSSVSLTATVVRRYDGD